MKEHDKVISPLARGTCYLLIYLTGIYPINAAVAGGITPDNPQTQVHHNGNVPVVEIAAPNNAGISHNTYQEFNTGAQGAVLNNATQAVNSQLAGQISANANLQGKAAELIINEVTGSSRSELLGQLEVAGQKANVMIANPNGITCDGCGFINTSGAILTTGKPQFDAQGALDALTVTKGQITIGGQGLNGQSTEYIDIISRATELNGKIQANTLSFTQGANQIAFKDGTAKTIAGEGAAPQLAVDTKALGGMYANKIRLIATENGVGVNLKDITSTQRDITLSANGRMELSNLQAKTDLTVGAPDIHIGPNVPVQAERNVLLAGHQVTNKGSVTAGQDMRVYGDTLSNSGPQAHLQAHKTLWIQKNAEGEKNTSVDNQSGTIKTISGDLIVRTKKLTNERENIKFHKDTKQPDQDRFLAIYNDTIVERSDGYGQINLFTEYELENAPDKWIGPFNLANFPYIKLEHHKFTLENNSTPAIIESGNNAYLYGNEITNKNSVISAKNDLIITGENLKNIGNLSGILEINRRYSHFKTDEAGDPTIYTAFTPIKTANIAYGNMPDRPKEVKETFGFSKTLYNREDIAIWQNENSLEANLIAGNNLVIDTKKEINLTNELPNEAKNINEIIIDKKPSIINAKNVTLHSNEINISNGSIDSQDNINIITDDNIKTSLVNLSAKNDIAIMSSNDINLLESELKTNNIFLNSNSGDINIYSRKKSFHSDNTRWLDKLEATTDLTLSSGKNIHLKNVFFSPVSKNISLYAGNNLTLENTDEVLEHQNAMQVLSFDNEKKLFNSIHPVGILNSSGSITINSGGDLSLTGISLNAAQDIDLYSGNNIHHNMRRISPIYSNLVDATSLFSVTKTPELKSEFKAGNNLLIKSSNDIILKGLKILANNSAYLLAGNSIELPAVLYSELTYKDEPYHIPPVDNKNIITTISARKELSLLSGNSILTQASKLNSDGNITILSDGNIRFESVKNYLRKGSTHAYDEVTTSNESELTSGGSLTISSEGSILFEGAKLIAKGLGATWKNPIKLSDWTESLAKAENEVKELQQTLEIAQRAKPDAISKIEKLKIEVEKAKDDYELTEAAYEAYTTDGPDTPIYSKWVQEQIADQLYGYLKENEKKLKQAQQNLDSEINRLSEVTNKITSLTSELTNSTARLANVRQEAQSKGADEAKQKAEIEAHNKFEAMRTGAINIAAKGGYLYAAASEESKSYNSKNQTSHNVNNKISEFVSSGDINLLSRDDSTYEASKIAAGKDVKLTSTHGSINFKSVNNSSFEQIFNISDGFFIKYKDKGHKSDKWVLPQINTNGNLIVNTATGINSDIKIKNSQTLERAITTLGNIPETSWIKDLDKSNDVKWDLVKDAYDSWDKSDTQLSPTGAAIITVVVAVVTAGTGLAASAGTSAATTIGGGAVTQGAVSAGVTALASKAAVSLVSNQGNLSDTLKDLGKSDTVKSIITSMAIGGALAGFDDLIGLEPAANGTTNTPLLSKGADWSKVAQRVAGQSAISSGLNTAINGGSFKDNFAMALLSNVGNQINAEGANVIGDYGKALGDAGKAISHAGISAIAAHIGGGDARGAAAGALAAELGKIALYNTFDDPAQILAGGKIIGGIAGAFATNSAEGVNSGANASEIVLEYNFFLHELRDLNKAVKEAKEKGEDTAPLFERKRNHLAQEREQVKAECLAYPTLCGSRLRWYANHALEPVESFAGRLYFDRDVIAFTQEESAKDNAVIDNYTNGFGQALEYALVTAKSLNGEEPRFSMTGKSIRPGIHNSQEKQPDSKPEVVVVNTRDDWKSGSKNNWTKELNKPKSNEVYHLDGNKTYHTDELGRTKSVESSLVFSKNDRNAYQQSKAGKSGNAGDDGGHLIATIFNGPGEKINTVPMDANLNRGAWKKMENKWADALKNGHQVQVKIDVSYKDNGARPDHFSVTYQVGNERPIRERFENAPGGK